jgi:hypothetical protein
MDPGTFFGDPFPASVFTTDAANCDTGFGSPEIRQT